MNRESVAGFLRERIPLMKMATVILWLTWIASIASSGFTKDIKGDPIGTDHIAFYSAAKLIDEGRGNRIYDNAFMSEYQTTLCGSPLLDAYRNPPFYALLYLPTSKLSYLASFWIWTAISVLFLWLGLGWLQAKNRFMAFVLSLSFYPVFAVFSFGQNSLISFGLFCLCFRFLERRELMHAGIVAGFLLYKPQLLLGLGLWWVLEYRVYWKALLGVMMTGLFWLVLSLLVLPDESRIFVENLPEIARYDLFHFWNMHNPRAFGTLIAHDSKPVGNIVGVVCSVLGVGCFVVFWRQHRKHIALVFAAAIVLSLWASPHTMIYEWTLALIPAVLLWDRASEKRDDWMLLFAMCWTALFISTPIAMAMCRWTRLDEGDPGWAIQLSVPVLAFAALWAMRLLSNVRTLDQPVPAALTP